MTRILFKEYLPCSPPPVGFFQVNIVGFSAVASSEARVAKSLKQ
jgi:hypothetical protein